MKRRYLWVSLVIVIVGVMLGACAPSPGPVSADVDEPVAAVADEGDMDDGEMDDADMDDDDMDANGEDQDDEDEDADDDGDDEAPAAPDLATASLVSQLSNQPGRAIVSARGNHFIVDSVPPIDGPNEERNPLDLMLGALATCGTFIYERVAEQQDIPLEYLIVTTEGDLDPSGVGGADVDPRLQAFRVIVDMAGPSEEEAALMAETFRTNCPIYTTLSRSAPIEVVTDPEDAEPAAEGLATASVVSQLSNQRGRAIVSARGNHFIVDSVPPLDGPNEERNPLDLMLAALGTCGTFLYEAAALEMDVALNDVVTTVEGDFDPRGVADDEINPRIQAFRVIMELSGPTDAEAEALAEEFRTRCPIYTTLSRSAPIEITMSTE
jgi:uncharacterized OsmC-like protein